jgi:hypothetical protein
MTQTTRARRQSSPKPPDWAGTAANWKARGGPHRITLPSGMRVQARVLGLASLARLDGLPDDLTDAVVLHVANLEQGGLPAVIGAELAAQKTDPEAAARLAKHVADFALLTRHLVAEALVEPAMTVGDLDQVPEDDLEMLMRIVTGRQAFDAAGIRIGVEPVDAWATFRHEHECSEDCPRCIEARRRLSSLHLDEL